MDLNSPYFQRIRIRPTADEPTADAPRCQHPGCMLDGVHRAPKGRLREGEYFRFCLQHVQEYNKNYNYFNGLSDDDVAAFQKDALTGHRPTWTMNVHAREAARAGDAEAAAAAIERLRRARAEAAQKPRRTIGNAARRALDVLGLDDAADPDAIRQRFKELVKRFHPDANGGDRSMEARMRAVIEAYNYLKQAKLA
jgi:curved DNA-binding protein CbpA